MSGAWDMAAVVFSKDSRQSHASTASLIAWWKTLNVSVKLVRAEDTIALRHRVMWPDAPREKVRLPLDNEAMHFGAFVESGLVGVGSFFPDGKACRLRKLAVDTAFQGQGVASMLIDHAVMTLRDRTCEMIWCDARVQALGFYHRNGFQTESDVFVKDGLEYVVARRYL